VNGLRRKGVDVFVITRGNLNNYDQKIFGIPTSDVSYWRRLFFMKLALTLLHELNKLSEFDLIHLNEPFIPMLGKLNLPTVCTIHSSQFNEIRMKFADLKNIKTEKDIQDLILKSPIGSICDIYIAHNTDRIICPSPDLARLLKSYCFADKEKISVIPNGIDLRLFEATRNCNTSILRKYGLETENYVLFVGRLSFFKGVQHLIAAFGAIKKEYPNIKLAIVGTGDFERYLRNLAHEMKDVVFTGNINSQRVKKILYQNSMVVVVPSIYEASPMVVLEAMACSKAVIASNVGGIPYLIESGRNGFLATPGDVQSLEKFIRLLYENPNLRKSMGLLGRRLVEREFTIDRMASRTLEVYESLL